MLNTQQQNILRETAYHSIEHGLKHHQPLAINPQDYDIDLQRKAATFVTLNLENRLRGCIGMLTPIRALIDDITNNAYSAAYSDHRFKAVTQSEITRLTIHISVLDKPEEINFINEEDLINQLHPGIDGLILEDGANKATFLPSVWESLSNKTEFLEHLKQKAGLPKNYWSRSIKIKRYRVESF